MKLLSKPNATRHLFFIFSLAAIQGLTLNLMPVMFRPLEQAFHISLAEQGQLQSLFFAGAVVALLASGWVTERIGIRRSGFLPAPLLAAGMITFGMAPGFSWSLIGAGMIGLGNQWVLAVNSAVITAGFPEARSKLFMWVAAAFAAAASVSPPALGFALTHFGEWRSVFVGGGIVIGVAGFLLDRLLGSHLASVPVPKEPERALPSRELLLSPTLWLIGFLVVLDQIAAGAIVSWTPRLLQLRYQATDQQASYVLSLQAIGVFAGRVFLGSLIAGRFTDRTILAICYGLGMLIYGVLLAGNDLVAALVLMTVVGALLAAQAPTIYSITSRKFAARAAVAVPLVDMIGSFGGIFTPTLIGMLADRLGHLDRAIWWALVAGLLLSLITLVWQYADRLRGDTE
ncbi:MAG TPA: MFS transporter [Bryobacteraceae bacterium]|nr:MFS transporter [Bryobacteraceae bacterium]